MKKNLLAPGHSACAGCGESLAIRLVLNAAGENIIVANATGCSEIFTSNYPLSAWEVPWIHSLFENTAAVASGIEAALKVSGRKSEAKVIAQGGDGGMADIGLQALSGMWERWHDVLSVCYDNEGYMNTGIQRSGLTPLDTKTTTTPPGKFSWGNYRPKKNLPLIAAAHGIPYVAVTTVAYPRDIEEKVQKAIKIEGPKYIQIYSPCPLGWRSEPSQTIEIARLAVETGIYPVYEMINGKITSAKKFSKLKPVEEFLKLQGRFSHLFTKEGGDEEIKKIQKIADDNINQFDMILKDGEELQKE